jgi:hypothetical protein
VKSDIKENVKKDATKYPCLKQVRTDFGKCVILFTENNKGFVVYTSGNNWHIGEYASNWAESDFTLFDGTITLAND